MFARKQQQLAASTPLSDFIRNASSADKKKIYKRVIDRANERQLEVLRQQESLAKR